jgi:hypothetical protein
LYWISLEKALKHWEWWIKQLNTPYCSKAFFYQTTLFQKTKLRLHCPFPDVMDEKEAETKNHLMRFLDECTETGIHSNFLGVLSCTTSKQRKSG